MEIKWVDGVIKITPPKNPKKLTGTRLAAVLGRSPWSTPFEIWCAVTRTYEEPFVDTIYTLAGKAIEPKQIEYMRKKYFMNILTPTDKYGKDYFKKTRGDFFEYIPIYGGMWDALQIDEDGNPIAVLEFKTTKRSEDWAEDVPEYYAIQASLYAYLLGLDHVIMVASFLENKDYEHPEAFEPNAQNTITVEFNISERYPDFYRMVDSATEWWTDHVTMGVSPRYDEKKDAEILKALRSKTLTPDTDIDALVTEAEKLKAELDLASALVADKQARLKQIQDIVKKYAITQFQDGDKKVTINGSQYAWTISRSIKTTGSFDEGAMKAAGIFDLYYKPKTEETYRLTIAERSKE